MLCSKVISLGVRFPAGDDFSLYYYWEFSENWTFSENGSLVFTATVGDKSVNHIASVNELIHTEKLRPTVENWAAIFQRYLEK